MPDLFVSSFSSCLTVMACCSCYAKRLLLNLSTDHRPGYQAFRAVEAGISARALASSGRWSDRAIHPCEVFSHARLESQVRLRISQKWLRLLYEYAARCNAYMLGITASFDGSHTRLPSDSSGCVSPSIARERALRGLTAPTAATEYPVLVGWSTATLTLVQTLTKSCLIPVLKSTQPASLMAAFGVFPRRPR